MHTLTIKGAEPLVVMTAEEYESMKETIELLSANPRLPEELKEQRRAVAKGRHITWSEFKKKHKVK